jgi:dienelactone hydrolase
MKTINQPFQKILLLTALTVSTVSAYESEDVTYRVPSFSELGQHFPAAYLNDYPNRDTAIPQPTQKLLDLDVYAAGNNPNDLTLFARVVTPVNAEGPLPAVVVLHGSGGLWPEGQIGGAMENQFEDWAEELTARGYLAIFPDSYNPRGIEEGFSKRLPHVDPQFDSDACSPQWDRPRDVLATLDYLVQRGDVDLGKVSVVSFSQGAETAYNAFNDASVGRNPTSYRVSRHKWNDEIDDHSAFTHSYKVPSPVQIPANHPAYPKFIALYYPGTHSWGYNGKITTVNANEYYPTTQAHVALFHGTSDILYGTSGYNAFLNRIAAHGSANNLPEQAFAHLEAYAGAEHGFDWKALSEEPSEANLLAFQAAREIVFGELALVGVMPDPKEGIVYGNDLAAPGMFFNADAGFTYTVYHQSSDGHFREVATIEGFSGQVALPFLSARDRLEEYSITYQQASPLIRR